MSLIYLNLLLIFGVLVLNSPSLAIRYPNHKPSPEYGRLVHKPPPKYNLHFHTPAVPVIPQPSETFKTKPVGNNRPSPASRPPVSHIPSVKPRAPPPPSTQEALTAYFHHPGHLPAEKTGN
ncbi:hypothetical protein ACET3Z_029502 [Daucus carota]